MWNRLKGYAVLCLVLFFVSLLIFTAAMPQFGAYLAALCALEWTAIFSYRGRDNLSFFLRVLFIGLGNALAFALQWSLMGRGIPLSRIGDLEIVLMALLFAGVVKIVFGIAFCAGVRRMRNGQERKAELLPEREYDLQRLEGLLQRGTQLIGVDARWGDGKTFLIDRMCASRRIRGRYEIVRVNVLAGNEDEIELTLMNEFDRILRRNRIFSLASKQMLKLLESTDVLKQLQWLLIEDTQSVSATFSCVLRDLEKLGKGVLIIVDDIERLGDDAQIRKVFALMESVSSNKVQIVYLFNRLKLTGFDRVYLEKYIPCYMNLTPVPFKSIVQALWEELEMDTVSAACKDVEQMEEFPEISASVTNILALDWIGGTHPFRLNNVTVRKVRVFLEEFRNLAARKRAPDGEDPVTPPKGAASEDKVLLKCVFIKHFLNDDFEKLSIGVSVTDRFLFRLNEEAREVLSGLDSQIPDRLKLFDLFALRRRWKRAEDIQRLMNALLTDNGNYNRLLALSMLGYDYFDLWQDIQKAERPGTKQNPGTAAAYNERKQFQLLMRAEQIGNQDISHIAREQNNERIDRIMWNLLANGTSERTDLEAYVRHFQELVLAAGPSGQPKAWEQFLSDGCYMKIYKNNVTRNRLGVDLYLPLFQGFRIINAPPAQWLKLLDFYFRPGGDNEVISAEMLQNLNYVDISDHRVYISVLKFFNQCRINGNLNSEPCMYKFLKQTLRMSLSLGYTENHMLHELRYDSDEPLGPDGLVPSKRWKEAVLGLVQQFDGMKRGLEQDRLGIPELSQFDSEIDVIICFIDKCRALAASEKAIGMRIPHIKIEERGSRSRHQELYDTLLRERRSGAERNQWYAKVRDLYEKGKLDPAEVRELTAEADKGKEKT